MKREWEIPASFKNKPIMLRLTPRGLEVWLKRQRELPLLFPWVEIARKMTGWNVVEPK